MNTFNLQKGGSFALDKGMTNIELGAGWNAGDNFDVDISAMGCVSNGGSPKFFNGGSHALGFFNKGALKVVGKSFETPDGSMHHSGDNLTGEGDGDDEIVTINTAKLPAEIDEVAIFATLYDAGKRGQSFDRVKDAYVHGVDKDTGKELFRYDLSNEFVGCASVQIGSFLKDGGNWSFKALGAGFNQEIGDILQKLS